MVDEPPLGVQRLRIAVVRLPVEPPPAGTAPDSVVVSTFGSLIPQMIVPYADAAALMLANLDRGHAMTRHRVGLALPVGLRGRRPQEGSRWSGGSGSRSQARGSSYQNESQSYQNGSVRDGRVYRSR
jgi:hypothetical protein